MDRVKAEQDLAFIRQTMEKSKNTLNELGLPYIIFGVMAVVGTALTYLAIYLELFSLILWVWIVLGAIAGVSAAIVIARMVKKSVRTFAGEVYGMVWLGTIIFISLTCICLFVSGNFSVTLMLVIVAASLGLTYFISSTITRNRGMFALSFVWWAGCIPMALIGDNYAAIIMAGLVTGCELIPGIILYSRWVKLQREEKEGKGA